MTSPSGNYRSGIPLLPIRMKYGESESTPRFTLRGNLQHVLELGMVDDADRFQFNMIPSDQHLEPILVLHPLYSTPDPEPLFSVILQRHEPHAALSIPNEMVRRLFSRSNRIENTVGTYTNKNRLLLEPLIPHLELKNPPQSTDIGLRPVGKEWPVVVGETYPDRQLEAGQSTLDQFGE